MIIRSRFIRRQTNQVNHLLSLSNNRKVVERHDLDRDCPRSLALAFDGFEALTRLNRRAVRSQIHIKVSPDHPLTERELLRVLDALDWVHGLAALPRKIIMHDKGERAPHFHVIFSTINPDTGRAIQSRGNYIRDETVSRLLEIELGERIVVGPRQSLVIAWCRENGCESQARILEEARGQPVLDELTAQKPPDRELQQNLRTGLTKAALEILVQDTWRDYQTPQAIVDRLQQFGVVVGMGRRGGVVAEHAESGCNASVARTLRKAGMRAGEAEVRSLFPQLPPLEAAVMELLNTGINKAQKAVENDKKLFRQEAILDSQPQVNLPALPPYELQRKRKVRPSRSATRDVLRYRQNMIKQTRQARIDRAFRAARVAGSPSLQKAASALIATGMLLIGATLPLILVGAALAPSTLAQISIMKKREARKLAAERDASRQAEERKRQLEREQQQRAAEQKRQQDIEAIRKASDERLLAEVNAQKLAEAERLRQLVLEQQRLAAERDALQQAQERQRQLDLEHQQEIEAIRRAAEEKRLADIKAQQLAEEERQRQLLLEKQRMAALEAERKVQVEEQNAAKRSEQQKVDHRNFAWNKIKEMEKAEADRQAAVLARQQKTEPQIGPARTADEYYDFIIEIAEAVVPLPPTTREDVEIYAAQQRQRENEKQAAFGNALLQGIEGREANANNTTNPKPNTVVQPKSPAVPPSPMPTTKPQVKPKPSWLSRFKGRGIGD